MNWKKIFLPIFVLLFFLSLLGLSLNFVGGCGKLTIFWVFCGLSLFFFLVSSLLLFSLLMKKQLVSWLVLVYSFLLIVLLILSIFIGVNSYTNLKDCPILQVKGACSRTGGNIFSNESCPKNYVLNAAIKSPEGVVCCVPVN